MTLAYAPRASAGLPLIRHERTAGGLAVTRAGNGPPLVVLHGGMGSWTHWVRNLKALAEHFSVYAFDLPGFGASDDISSDTSLDDYIGHVVTGIDAILPSPTRFAVAAFSFGGFIGTGVLARMNDRIKRASLLAPGGWGPHKGGAVLEMKARRRDMTPAEVDETIRYNLSVMMLAHPESIDAETMEIQRHNVGAARFKHKRIRTEFRVIEFLAATRMPLQLLWGERDRNAYPSFYDRLDKARAVRPDLEFAVVPDAGHWAQYERAADYNRLALGFLCRA
ncbi:MAG: alpha/beta fold hydrolase [Alphaproteobacteria bacterium]